MTYFVYIESEILAVPHMEPLVSEDADEALAEASELMVLHASALRAHVFNGDQRVGTGQRP